MPFMRDRLKQRRLDMGLTLEEVANELNVERPTIQRYESGKIKSISTTTVEALAQALHCSPAYLMGWSDSVDHDKNIYDDLIVDSIGKRMPELLKHYRELAGLTVYQVGELIGKSGKTVSAWENGRGQPDADMFLKLCDVYHVESVAVFFGQETKPVEEKTIELTDDEKRILELYRNATDAGREAAEVVLQGYQKPEIKGSVLTRENAV